MCSALPTFREPWNITCSNRWAKPVLPSTSCFEPTSYQRFTATTGASRSTEMIRRNPLGRRSSVNETVGTEGIGGGLQASLRVGAGAIVGGGCLRSGRQTLAPQHAGRDVALTPLAR